MNQAIRGFTLIELMVVIAIIGVLATVVFVGARPAGEQARDAQRQADLRDVQTALEMYENRYGRYPEGCNGVTTLNTFGNPVAGVWSGQAGSSYACSDPTDPYILGDASRPFAEFMVNLPTDPQPVSGNEGYVYTTNEEGSVYKFMAKNTVEADTIDYDHPFKSCDRTFDLHKIGSAAVKNDLVANGYGKMCNPVHMSAGSPDGIQCDIGLCDRLYNGNNYNSIDNNDGSYTSMRHCVAGSDGNGQFERTYAVWGGFSHVTNDFFLQPGEEQGLRVHIERQTENIICRLP